MQKRILAPLASASAVALAMAVGPAVANTGDQQGQSSSDITVEDCLVESSKDISYIAFHDDGEQIDKQEFDDEGGTFDLASVEDIDDVDSVAVKSGTTVEEFDVECVSDDASTDDGTKEDDTEEDDTTDGDQKSSQGRSGSDITLEDCLIESSKDISYIAFHDDGEQIDKQEFDDEGGTFDLTSVEGIDDVDEIDVKAGTTLETFAVDCPTEPAGEQDDQDTSPDETDDTDKDHSGDTTSDDETDTMDGSEATITVEGCLVESSKDISYIAYFDDGTQVDKENINSETFDLSTVDGIDEIDSIEVKSGTTVEDFAIDCASGDESADTAGDASDDTEHSDDTTSDDTEEHEDADHDPDDDEEAEDEEEHESDDADDTSDDTSDDEEEDHEDDH